MTAPKPPTTLTKRQAFQLCKDLLGGYSHADFQRELKELMKGCKYVVGWLPGRAELALTVQSKVLPKYGFPGTPAGVHTMFDTLAPLLKGSSLQQMKVLLEDKLGMNAETLDDRLLSFFRSDCQSSDSGTGDSDTDVRNQTQTVSRDFMLGMAMELVQGFSTADFQEKLQKLSPDDLAGRKKLALPLQKKVLLKFGIPGTSSGVEFMLRSIEPHVDDLKLLMEGWMMQMMLQNIEGKLSSVEQKLPTLLSKERPDVAAKGGKHAEQGGASLTKDQALTKDKAFKMLWELLDGYSSPDFQQQLEVLACIKSDLARQRPNRKTSTYIPGRGKLARATVQSQVLPNYCIPATCDGEKVMHEKLAPFKNDWMLQVMLWAIDIQLAKRNESIDDGLLKFVRSHAASIQVSLSKADVLSMVKEILDGFNDPDFQAELQEFLSDESSAWDMPGRIELALTVWSKVLPKYGIPGTSEGIAIMLEAMVPVMDEEMEQLHVIMLGAISPFKSDWMLLMDTVVLEDLLQLVNRKICSHGQETTDCLSEGTIVEIDEICDDIDEVEVLCLARKMPTPVCASKFVSNSSDGTAVSEVQSIYSFPRACDSSMDDIGMKFKRQISGASTTCSAMDDDLSLLSFNEQDFSAEVF